MATSYSFPREKFDEIREKLAKAIKDNDLVLKDEFIKFNKTPGKTLIEYIDFYCADDNNCEPRFNQLNEYLRKRLEEIYFLVRQSLT